MKIRRVFITLACSAGCLVMAAPSLQITKPPVIGGPNAGPVPQDPDSLQGQWFQSGVKTHEFYDNVTGYGGGAASFGAIEGYTSNIQVDGLGNIIAFDIVASVTNDTNSSDTTVEMWRSGSNSHSETLTTVEQYVGTLYDSKMVIEFAVASAAGPFPSSWVPPYYQGSLPMIEATNEDDLAWYCFNDNEGNYYVPTWNFGDIALGQTATKTLSFQVGGGGLNPLDPRYSIIMANDFEGSDILLNRTTSLKISHWIENMAADDGSPYPADSQLSSNASVFHDVPEPASLAMLGLGCALLLQRRRRN